MNLKKKRFMTLSLVTDFHVIVYTTIYSDADITTYILFSQKQTLLEYILITGSVVDTLIYSNL